VRERKEAEGERERKRGRRKAEEERERKRGRRKAGEERLAPPTRPVKSQKEACIWR